MESTKKMFAPVIVLWIISIGNLFRMNILGEVRTVTFLSIFVTGMLTGLAVIQIRNRFKQSA